MNHFKSASSMVTLITICNSYRWHATRRSELENTTLRAFTGAAMLFGEGPISAKTVAEAAASVAVCGAYIIAAGQILKAGDEELLRAALRGNVSLMAAAERARARLYLLRGFQAGTPEDLKAVGAIVGTAVVWDGLIAPQL
jgi:hypothetical protein